MQHWCSSIYSNAKIIPMTLIQLKPQKIIMATMKSATKIKERTPKQNSYLYRRCNAIINRRVQLGEARDIVTRDEHERHRTMDVDTVLEVGFESQLREQYACDYEDPDVDKDFWQMDMRWYCSQKDKPSVSEDDEVNPWGGKKMLIGRTGRLGYIVPKADREYNISLLGRYINNKKNPMMSGHDKEVCVYKKYMIPRKIEELICVETNLNACSPLSLRESPGTSMSFAKCERFPHRTNQFELVAWQSRPDRNSGYQLWRMGYVLNDMGCWLRVMIPNGRWFILATHRVVKFDFAIELVNGDEHEYDYDIPDSSFLSKKIMMRFRDDDWNYAEDYDRFEENSTFSVEHVKDKQYPLRDGKKQREIRFSDM